MKSLYRKFENQLLRFIDHGSRSRLLMLALGGILFVNLGVLLIPEIPHAHDLTFQLSRISSIADAFKLGEIPRVYPNYFEGYGYANGLFYGDILLYIPALLVVLGMKVVTAYKWFLLVLTIATMASIYYCTKTMIKSRYASLIAVILCTLSSYRTVDIFVRGSLAEVCAFVFVPLILVGLYYVLYDNPKRWYWLSIGFAGCFLTHNISFALMVGFTFLFVCFAAKRLWIERSRFVYLVLATIVTVAMVGYFLFPMLEQMMSDQFVLTTQTVHSDIAASTRSTFEVFIGLPYRKYDGIAGIGIIFVIILACRWNKKNGRFDINQLSDQMYLFTVLSIWAVTPLFPWKLILKVLSPLAMIQFCWRLFLMITVFLSILGGIYATNLMTSLRQKIRFFLICFILTLIPFGINMGQQYVSYFYHTYVTKLMEPVDISTYSVGLGEYLPADVDPDWIINRGEVITSNNDEVQVSFERHGLTLKVNYEQANNATYLDLPLIYYKGYETTDDSLTVMKSNEGLVRILLNGNEIGEFTISYEGTIIAKVTLIISLITVAGLALYIYNMEGLSKRKVM